MNRVELLDPHNGAWMIWLAPRPSTEAS